MISLKRPSSSADGEIEGRGKKHLKLLKGGNKLLKNANKLQHKKQNTAQGKLHKVQTGDEDDRGEESKDQKKSTKGMKGQHKKNVQGFHPRKLSVKEFLPKAKLYQGNVVRSEGETDKLTITVNDDVSFTHTGDSPKKSKKFVNDTKGKPSTNRKPAFEKSDRKFSTVAKPFKTNMKNSIMKLNADGKPNWKEMKQSEKERRMKRKELKFPHYDATVKAKKLWEEVRREDCVPDKRDELTSKLFGLLKGQLHKMVFTHDMARIVQWLLKLGSPVIRSAIVEEVKPILGSMVQSKYSNFCVKRMLKYGSPDMRHSVMGAFKGNIVKFMSHVIASPVIEYAYDHWATLTQRNSMKQEFYGDVYKLSQGEKIRSIADAMSKSPGMESYILTSTKKNLLHIIGKELLNSSLVVTVLLEFLMQCSAEDRQELLTQITPKILNIVHIREGARIGMMCCWYSNPQERKKIMKNLKGHVKEVAFLEHGYLFLCALFDSVDDTVALTKVVISQLITDLMEIATNEHGRKVLLYLVAHRDPLYFHPDLLNILKVGDKSETIKKSMDVREAELGQSVLTSLLESIANDPSKWFNSGSIAMVTLAALKLGKGSKYEEACKAIAEYICSDDSMIEENDVKCPVIEHTGTHMVIKKLISHDKGVINNERVPFSTILVQELTQSTIGRWITCNRGCFILVGLIECGVQSAKETLMVKLGKSVTSQLKMQSSVGAQIMLSKLLQSDSKEDM